MTRSFPNGHRVLDHAGRVAEGFRWPAGDDRGDVLDVLRAEGVSVSDSGIASASQRLSVRDLADLLDMTDFDVAGAESGTAPSTEDRRDRFFSQLAENNSQSVTDAVRDLLRFWESLGGYLDFGTGAKSTSCFLILDRDSADLIWPMVVYPGNGGCGKLEIVFQHLAARDPITDTELRNQFRFRIDELTGVDVPVGKLDLRPGFALTAITEATDHKRLCDALVWFRDTALERSPELGGGSGSVGWDPGIHVTGGAGAVDGSGAS